MGCCVTSSGEEGFTGLMLATALRNHGFVKLLLQAGADPWKLTRRHKTYALWLAAKQKRHRDHAQPHGNRADP